MDTKELFNKIGSEIKEYGYLTFNMDCISTKLDNYSFNVSVSYNKLFSENIKFIVYNRVESILMNSTINIKDLDYMQNKLNKEVF